MGVVRPTRSQAFPSHFVAAGGTGAGAVALAGDTAAAVAVLAAGAFAVGGYNPVAAPAAGTTAVDLPHPVG